MTVYKNPTSISLYKYLVGLKRADWLLYSCGNESWIEIIYGDVGGCIAGRTGEAGGLARVLGRRKVIWNDCSRSQSWSPSCTSRGGQKFAQTKRNLAAINLPSGQHKIKG